MLRDEWLRCTVPPETPGAGWEQFREMWAAREEKPDGLLVTDDMLFRDVALAILDLRLSVPQQLQVVAHANKGSGVAYPFPASCLEVDLNEWAAAMMDRLIKLMNGEPVSPPVHHIRARLIPAEPKQIEHNHAVVSSSSADLGVTNKYRVGRLVTGSESVSRWR
jgi:DNA-binding LacI/PurR family transcriptional regulator